MKLYSSFKIQTRLNLARFLIIFLDLSQVFKPIVIILLRRLLAIQISNSELLAIHDVISQIKQSNMLIFGVGNDSILWASLNKRGKTIFLEDNIDWLNNIANRYPQLIIQKVQYSTKRKDYMQYIENPESFPFDLPQDINTQAWDLVLVDAPAGYNDDTPGRMQSIYTAHKLLQSGGYLFIHDMNRHVEQVCVKSFLFDAQLIIKVGKLSGYKI